MTFQVQARWLIAGFLILLLIFGLIWYSHPRIVEKEKPVEKIVTVTQKEIQDPVVLEKIINVPYPVAAEITRDIPNATPTNKPETDPDQIIRVTTPISTQCSINQTSQNQNTPYKEVISETKQYNIVYDRKLGVGPEYTNQFKGLEIEYKPEHWLGVEVKGGSMKNGDKYYGIGVKFWFK